MGLPNEDWVTRHRISVADYYRMGEAGIFPPGARVELIEGEVIDMAPIGSTHAGEVTFLSTALHNGIGDRAIVSVQNPVRMGTDTESEPDITVLKVRQDFYRASHPGPSDVLLIVEVADSSLAYDRDVKLPLYARHGIPEVWLVDLQNRLMSSYRDPAGELYRDVRTTATPGLITLSQMSDVSVDLKALFV